MNDWGPRSWGKVAASACAALLLTEAEAARAQAEPPPTVPLTAELKAELDSYVASVLVEFDVPGAALAVIQGSEVVYTRAFGVRDVESQAPVNVDTRFMIGSVTKSMTATLAATLVDDGLVDWDDAAFDLLPAFSMSDPDLTPLVRLRDLLGHMSGLPRDDVALFFDFQSPFELMSSVAALPSLAPPGQLFEYQNQVFAIGGFALARAAGAGLTPRALARGYASSMQERVFDRVGMPRTTLDFERALRGNNRALPHAYDPITARVTPVPAGFERFAIPVAPSGAVWSSVEDMARYMVTQVQEGVNVEGERVVSVEELLTTHTAQVPIAEGMGYGLGWLVMQDGPVKVITHDGGTAGFSSLVFAAPDQDFALVVLSNRAVGALFQEAVRRYVVELVLGVEHEGDVDLLAQDEALRAAYAGLLAATAPVTPRAAEPLVGRYERGVSVSHRGEFLVIGSVYGELSFLAVPGNEGVFISVGNVVTRLVAQLTENEAGELILALGLPNFETGELMQSIELSRLTPRHPRCRPHRGPRHDLRRLWGGQRHVPPWHLR